MELSLRISIALIAIMLFLFVFQCIRRGRIPIKFALVWFFVCFVLFVLVLFPNVIEVITGYIGFETLSNFIVGLLFVILLLVTIVLTVIVSGQKTKITLLVQEVSLLKSRVHGDVENYNENIKE